MNVVVNGDNGEPPESPERPELPDARDLIAAKAGDHQAFARLYDRHAPLVLSLCRRSIDGSLAEAEDATQETFMRAHRMLDRLDNGPGLRSWLCAIAQRVSAEHRRAARRRTTHEGRAGIDAGERAPQSSSRIEDIERREALERLSGAIEQLDERERLAVHLHYLDAEPVRAAADALRLSRSGYYKLLARARDRLAVLMQEVPAP